MTREEYDALPVGAVLVKETTACPQCNKRGGIEITITMDCQPPGEWSLAGTQIKFPARKGARYNCAHCGAHGSAAPKDHLA